MALKAWSLAISTASPASHRTSWVSGYFWPMETAFSWVPGRPRRSARPDGLALAFPGDSAGRRRAASGYFVHALLLECAARLGRPWGAT